MTIQVPNPGTGNGATGDNEFVLWSKVEANFEDQTNAASRLVGNAAGNIPDVSSSTSGSGLMGIGYGGIYSAALPYQSMGLSASELPSGFYNNTSGYESGATGADAVPPAGGLYNYINLSRNNSSASQIAVQCNAAVIRMYVRSQQASGGSFTDWAVVYTSKTKDIYDTTTASGANVVVSSSGQMMRSTSSERYKDIIADLELDDAAYANAMQIAPIVYRSNAEADNPNYHYYSFSAEALGAYDPAFTLWRDTETVTDEDGNTSERSLDERIAEGINLNAIVAFLHATNVKQGKLIAEQAEAIATLTKRIDDITVE